MDYCRLYDKSRSASCFFFLLIILLACVGCTSSVKEARKLADRLNREAYVSRYKNLETTRQCAESAYASSIEGRYPFGQCDALINLAFYHIARMQYDKADSLLKEAKDIAPDNTAKLSVEVLEMRLCQRRSMNKDFFVHKFQAEQFIMRIHNTIHTLSQHQRDHYTWARSEYGIVLSAYLYYLGHEEESSKVLLDVAEDNDIYLRADTAQWLNYIYNVGSGGILRNMPAEKIRQSEVNYLMQCYVASSRLGYLYWEANSLQSLSEHLSSQENIEGIRKYDAASLRYLNDRDLPDSLLSKHLAEKALEIFVRYGDTYQSAAAWRTLADTYFREKDYEAMLNCLLNATSDTLIYQAPTIVSTINERLCIAFSAINEKPTADYLRNQYLDIQDSIRQDKQMEARAEALTHKVGFLKNLVLAIICVLLVFCVVLFVLIKYRKSNDVKKRLASLTDHLEELKEEEARLSLEISDAIRLNMEEHAKISMVQSMQPLIDRMQVASRHKLEDKNTLDYLSELCKSVEHGNEQLTKWIQLRKGSIKLHIETFAIQQVFDLLSLNNVSFTSKGINLIVEPSDLYIKADKTLTLFLLNTIVDNARKFTPEGGAITVSCKKSSIDGYADISVSDTGVGMTQEEADHLFEYRVIDNSNENLSEQRSHGFGLMNCRGIIDRYRKSTTMFSNTSISATSRVGEGTTINFRLPMIAKMILVLVVFLFSYNVTTAGTSTRKYSDKNLQKAEEFYDSMYYSNINERYSDCLVFSDSCRKYLNAYYLANKGNVRDTLSASAGTADLEWWKQKVNVDFELLLAIRNEAAVAALSLHEWDLYKYNNSQYIALYHEYSADSSFSSYYQRMEKYETYADLALIVLAFLVVCLLYVFYKYYIRDIVVAKENHKSQIAELENRIAVLSSEHNRLHVTISIADNCLSTIKHETMYYPSRISHLIGVKGEEQTLRETISFYRTLYLLLSSHCQKMLADAPIKVGKIACQELVSSCSRTLNICCDSSTYEGLKILGNMDLLQYVFSILRKKNSGAVDLIEIETSGSDYVSFVVSSPSCSMSDEQIASLFHISTHDWDYLIIKQILREIGDKSFRYGSGITAYRDMGGIRFRIMLPKAGG